MYMRLMVLLLVASVLLAGCEPEPEVVEEPYTRTHCELVMGSSSNATISGKVYECDVNGGTLYIYEGVDIEWVP